MTYNQPPDPREGCFKNTAIIAVVILVSLIVLVMVIRSDAQPVASAARETYVKPDSCFWEEVDIGPYNINTLSELLRVLEGFHGGHCARFAAPGNLAERFQVKLTRTKGPILEILREAIRGSDLVIEIIPPGQVMVYRRKEEGL